MDKFQLFMVAERKNRILSNRILIEKIKQEMDSLNVSTIYPLNQLAKEHHSLDLELCKLEESYESQKDKSILFTKSELIQSLTDRTVLKTEQLGFMECLKDGLKEKNQFLSLVVSFKRFYKYQKKITEEDIYENNSFLHILFLYLKQYYIFMQYKKILPNEQNSIDDIIIKVTKQKENMIKRIEDLKNELEERSRILRIYPKKKQELQEKMKEITEKIDQLTNSSEYQLYQQKVVECLDLELLNQSYEGQIEKLMTSKTKSRVAFK